MSGGGAGGLLMLIQRMLLLLAVTVHRRRRHVRSGRESTRATAETEAVATVGVSVAEPNNC